MMPDPTPSRSSYALTREQLNDRRVVKATVLRRKVSFQGLRTKIASPWIPRRVTADFAKTIESIHGSIGPLWIYRRWSMRLLHGSVNLICLIADNYLKLDFEKAESMVKDLYGEVINVRKDIQDWMKTDCTRTFLCRCLRGTLKRSEELLLKLLSDVHSLVVPESIEMIRVLKREILLAKDASLSAELTRACHELYAVRTNSKLDICTIPADLGNEVEEIKPFQDNQMAGEGIWLEREMVTIKTSTPLRHIFRRKDSGKELFKRFKNQVDQWRALDHPHVLRLYGWYELRHTAYFVTPRVEMVELHRFIAEDLDISGPDRLRLMKEIVLGLVYMHGHGVTHGALSPHTIFVNSSRSAILADFSLAQFLDPSYTETSVDPEYTIQTLRYQAPEAFMKQTKSQSPRDIYSLAMSSLEIISGVLPYPQENEVPDLLQRLSVQKRLPVVEEHPTEMWDAFPGLWDLLQSCITVDHIDRQPDLKGILRRIEEFQDQLAGSPSDFI